MPAARVSRGRPRAGRRRDAGPGGHAFASVPRAAGTGGHALHAPGADGSAQQSPANLARYTTGHACTVLSLSIWKGQKYTAAHAVPLVRMDAAGNCEFVTWGHRFSGKWEPVELPGHKKEDPAARILPTYELKVTSTNPDTKDFSDYRFILDHKAYDSLHVIVPNKRRAAVPGKQGGK